MVFAASECSRYNFAPNMSQQKAPGTLLKHDKVVFLKTDGSLLINFFAYSDFSGLWSCEDPWYPTRAIIITYFVIYIGEFPVEWKGNM